jgi:hypothetical protein
VKCSKSRVIRACSSATVMFIFVFSIVVSLPGCSGGAAPPVAPSQQTIDVAINPQALAVGTGQTVQLTATVKNDSNGVVWTASSGTIDAAGNYTAPPGPNSSLATITAISKTDSSKSASATVNIVAPGQISSTNNAQVALYTISPPATGNVSVQFGVTTAYGFTTWSQPIPQGGGALSLFVAGMLANTPYHIRGVVQFADGTQFKDADQTFTTGTVPSTLLPNLTATTTPGMTPQSGVELLDMVTVGSPTNIPEVVVTDLAGNALWAYQPTLPGGPGPNPIS